MLATLFFATSLSLAYLAGQQTVPTSLIEQSLENLPPATAPQPQFVPTELPDLPDLPGLDLELPPELPADPAGGEPAN